MTYRKCKYGDSEVLLHGIYQISEPIEPSPMAGGHPGGQLSYPVALIEFNDGRMIKVLPENLRFIDFVYNNEFGDVKKW